MVPCEPHLLSNLEVVDLIEDGGILLVAVCVRVHVAGELRLLLVTVLARLLVVLVLEDLEGAEVLWVVAPVRAERCEERALAVDDAGELGNRAVARENIKGPGHV